MNRDKSLQAVGRVLALVLAVSLIAQGAIMGALAESWDSETTNTGTTSDVQGDTSVTYQPFDDTEQNLFLEISGGNNDTDYALQVIDPQTNTVYLENASPDNPASGHYSWEYTHAELAEELPNGVDASDVQMQVVDGEGNVLVGPATVTLTPADNKFDRIRLALGAEGGELGVDALNVEETDGGFLGFGDSKTVAKTGISADIDNDTAPIVLEVEDADVQTAFDAMVEDAEEGERLDAQVSTVKAGEVPVYYGAAPSDAPDTHAVVYDADGDGTEEIEMQLGADTYGDAQQLDVDLVLNEDYGFIEQFRLFGSDGLGLPDLNPLDDSEESSN